MGGALAGDARHSTPFTVSKLDGGLVGRLGSAGGVSLTAAYGPAPKSYMLFTRLGL